MCQNNIKMLKYILSLNSHNTQEVITTFSSILLIKIWDTKKWSNSPRSYSLKVAELGFEPMHSGCRACFLYYYYNAYTFKYNVVNCDEWYKEKYHLQRIYTQPNLAWGSQGMPLKSIDFEAEVGRTTEDRKR